MAMAGPVQGGADHSALLAERGVRVTKQRLEVLAIHSYPPWRFPIDDLVCRFSHHLAPGNIYQVRLPASTSSGLASTGV